MDRCVYLFSFFCAGFCGVRSVEGRSFLFVAGDIAVSQRKRTPLVIVEGPGRERGGVGWWRSPVWLVAGYEPAGVSVTLNRLILYVVVGNFVILAGARAERGGWSRFSFLLHWYKDRRTS